MKNSRSSMKGFVLGWSLLLSSGVVFGLGQSVPTGKPKPSMAMPPFKSVVVIVLENENQGSALEQKYMKSLLAQGALLNNYHGVTHPSQPNYVAMVAGSTLGVGGDGNVTLNAQHLGDVLEAQGLSWKVYAEDYPGNCFLGATSGNYARRHVPFLSFENIQKNPERCQKVAQGEAFDQDSAHGVLPNFALYVPNVKNDGHDTGAAFADRWLEKRFGPYFKDPEFMKDTLFVITFDESGFSFTNHIYTVLVGDHVKPGSVNNVHYTHYNLLRSIEDIFLTHSLGRGDSQVYAITGVWK